MMTRLKMLLPLVLLALSAIFCAGCSLFEAPKANAAAVNYSDQSLHNYKQGQYYASAGRFELAREYYLLALAATSDPEMQEAISRDLEAADAAIYIQR